MNHGQRLNGHEGAFIIFTLRTSKTAYLATPSLLKNLGLPVPSLTSLAIIPHCLSVECEVELDD